MSRRHAIVLRANHALAALGMVAAALAIWPWLPHPAGARKPPEPAGRASPAAAVPHLAPFASFAAIIERPLFSPTRRPAAVRKAMIADGGLARRYRVLGLMTAGPEHRALLAEGAHILEVHEGQPLAGWRIRRIEHDRLILSSPAGEAVLRLHPAAAAGPAPADAVNARGPAAPPARGAGATPAAARH